MLRFNDGVNINVSGPKRKLKLSDGFYVVGKGMCIPCGCERDANEILGIETIVQEIQWDPKEKICGTKGDILVAIQDGKVGGYAPGPFVSPPSIDVRKGEKYKITGDRIDDGIVRIEYTFEKPKPTYTSQIKPHVSHPLPFGSDSYYKGSPLRSMSFIDEGITVRGEDTHQEYSEGSVHNLESFSNTIILRLKGRDNTGAQIVTPIVTRRKIECLTCGDKSDSSANCCSNCGTSLKIIQS